VTDLADYIADHYGRCALPKCICLRDRVEPGRACIHWRSVVARTFDELKAAMRACEDYR
jgi:hypothetical protein